MTLSTTERTASHRAKRKAEGWTNLNCWLPAEAAEILAKAMKKYPHKTKAEIVLDAIFIYDEEGMMEPTEYIMHYRKDR